MVFCRVRVLSKRLISYQKRRACRPAAISMAAATASTRKLFPRCTPLVLTSSDTRQEYMEQVMEDLFGRYFKSKEGRLLLRQVLKNAFENIDVHHVMATVSHSTLFAAAGESDMWLRDDPALVL